MTLIADQPRASRPPFADVMIQGRFGRERQNGERTNQGHSIGSWEGEVLVVDTTLFADSRTGNLNGIPAGAQKHVVETYELSEDRTQLTIEFIVEDPEYMVEPMTGSVVWDYARDREMLPFGCELENARLYELQ